MTHTKNTHCNTKNKQGMEDSLKHVYDSLTSKDYQLTKHQMKFHLILYAIQFVVSVSFYGFLLFYGFNLGTLDFWEIDTLVSNLCIFSLFRGRKKIYLRICCKVDQLSFKHANFTLNWLWVAYCLDVCVCVCVCVFVRVFVYTVFFNLEKNKNVYKKIKPNIKIVNTRLNLTYILAAPKNQTFINVQQ